VVSAIDPSSPRDPVRRANQLPSGGWLFCQQEPPTRSRTALDVVSRVQARWGLERPQKCPTAPTDQRGREGQYGGGRTRAPCPRIACIQPRSENVWRAVEASRAPGARPPSLGSSSAARKCRPGWASTTSRGSRCKDRCHAGHGAGHHIHRWRHCGRIRAEPPVLRRFQGCSPSTGPAILAKAGGDGPRPSARSPSRRPGRSELPGPVRPTRGQTLGEARRRHPAAQPAPGWTPAGARRRSAARTAGLDRRFRTLLVCAQPASTCSDSCAPISRIRIGAGLLELPPLCGCCRMRAFPLQRSLEQMPCI